jgi:hypothetical protein
MKGAFIMRNIKRSIDQYKNTFGKTNNTEGAFYLSDYQQILSMSNNNFELVSNALRAGFMIGYRKGRKHEA